MSTPSVAPAYPSVPADTDTARIIGWLEKGTESQRTQIERSLKDPAFHPDRAAIRLAVLRLLNTKYRAAAQPKDDNAEEKRIANTRAWLLYMLPLVADKEPDCVALLRDAVNVSIELNKWCRYWCLAGQYRAHWSGIAFVISEVVQAEPEDLVVMLAHAIRAEAEVMSNDRMMAPPRPKNSLMPKPTVWDYAPNHQGSGNWMR